MQAALEIPLNPHHCWRLGFPIPAKVAGVESHVMYGVLEYDTRSGTITILDKIALSSRSLPTDLVGQY